MRQFFEILEIGVFAMIPVVIWYYFVHKAQEEEEEEEPKED